MIELDYRDMFNTMHPGFFEKSYIQAIDPDEIFSEMILGLSTYEPLPPVRVSENIRYILWQDDKQKLYDAVQKVIPEWVEIFKNNSSPILCGMDGNRILSFCLLEDMKSYKGLRIGGPGCVGTIPETRGRGVGLRMVQLATEYFQREGYDISYIHYTGVAPWYEKLGYKTILTWTRNGFCD